LRNLKIIFHLEFSKVRRSVTQLLSKPLSQQTSGRAWGLLTLRLVVGMNRVVGGHHAHGRKGRFVFRFLNGVERWLNDL
jgi:hypothetical protein